MKLLQFLIVKTSSLGDIIQAFCALEYLHDRANAAAVDWVVEEKFADLVRAHPLVRRIIPINLKRDWPSREWLARQWQAARMLRQVRYDAVFDLQGNSKSGLWTLLARSKQKVGFSAPCVREWLNLLATRQRFGVSLNDPIRRQYLQICQRYVGDDRPFEIGSSVDLRIEPDAADTVQKIADRLPQSKPHVMVCPGARWINKQLSEETLIEFLQRIEGGMGCFFVFIWGSQSEKRLAMALQERFPANGLVIDRLGLPAWQQLMRRMDLVLAVDSSALHLCATTNTPSFSIFGPTRSEVFKPDGFRHFAYQGSCPYGKTFVKQCPILRSCPTGACIHSLRAEELFNRFQAWWEALITR